MEHPCTSALLVGGGTGLSLVLIWIAAAASRLVRCLGRERRRDEGRRDKSDAASTRSAASWWAGTALMLLLAALHPLLSAGCALLEVSSAPADCRRTRSVSPEDDDEPPTTKRGPQSAPALAEHSDVGKSGRGEGTGEVLGALTLLCIIVRVPGLIALVRGMAVSAKGLDGQLTVYYQERFGPSLESFTGGALGGGVGSAVTVDILVAILLPMAARLRSSASRPPSVAARQSEAEKESETRCGSACEVVFDVTCGMLMVMVEEDVYLFMWITLLFFVQSAVLQPLHLPLAHLKKE
jgi:hypothetical protein